MFGKSEHSRKKSSFFPLVLFRMLLSLAMFLVLGVLFYQAFLYFSGAKQQHDPLTFLKSLSQDPKTTLIALISSEESSKLLSQLRGAGVPLPVTPIPSQTSSKPLKKSPQPSGQVVLKFALVADSHNDNSNLEKALREAKGKGAKFIIGLGDYTATGTLPELLKAKEVFDNANLPYYLTAGDHDLWDSRDKKQAASQNFNQVFGSPYQSFVDSNIRFVIVYNSDNYEGVDSLQRLWVEEILEKIGESKAAFVFLHEPLSHPTSDRVMGSPRKAGEAGKTKEDVAKQAKELSEMFKEVGVAEIFAGDIHAYSKYEALGLRMTTVGALTSERNLQPPRFALVEVFENGSYNILDIELKP